MRTIEVKDNTEKAYLMEVINILMQAQKLQKDPTGKLNALYQRSQRIMVIGIPAVLAFLVLGLRGHDTLLLVASGVLALCMVVIGVYLRSLSKVRRDLAAKAGDHVLTIDKKGVESRSSDGEVVRVPWKHITALRVYTHTVCFMPDSQGGYLLHVDKKYLDEILDAVAQEHPELRMIQVSDKNILDQYLKA